MAFKLRQDVREGQLRRAILYPSLTFKVGDLIIPQASDNAITNATSPIAGDKYPMGLLVGFSKKNGEVISQGQDPLNTPNQLTTTANNLTTEKYYGVYVPIDGDMEFSALLDATAGTTSGSDAVFTWFNLVDCRTVDESSVVVFSDGSAPLQIFSYGLDPMDTTNKTIICRIAKSAVTKP